MLKRVLQRVDTQVTILIVIMVALSGCVIYTLVYSMSYKEMINMLSQNVNSLATHIDESLNMDVFSKVTTKEDMSEDIYTEAHIYLDKIRTISEIKYLYTATKNENGDLIYHIDGLPYDDPEFRNVGDLIESDFIEPLSKALQNNIVMPDDILETPWGSVFVAYYPLHDEEGNVVAALGIEFPAERQYNVYEDIRLFVTIVLFIICFLTGIVSRILFQRISNPHFRDIYNTDSLTKLKNRSAFDTDIHNGIHRQKLNGIILVITDLNGLKPVNDKFGHKMGDFYIESCAKALLVESMDYCIVYRIGGDEFATIIPAVHSSKVEEYIEIVQEQLIKICESALPSASVSMGYAECEGTSLSAWEKVLKDADEAMYNNKRAYYEKNKALNERKM